MERSFYKVSLVNLSRLNFIYDCVGFDELSITSVISELMIKGPNHMITTSRGSLISSAGLSLHTARYHWWIVGSIRII